MYGDEYKVAYVSIADYLGTDANQVEELVDNYCEAVIASNSDEQIVDKGFVMKSFIDDYRAGIINSFNAGHVFSSVMHDSDCFEKFGEYAEKDLSYSNNYIDEVTSETEYHELSKDEIMGYHVSNDYFDAYVDSLGGPEIADNVPEGYMNDVPGYGDDEADTRRYPSVAELIDDYDTDYTDY